MFRSDDYNETEKNMPSKSIQFRLLDLPERHTYEPQRNTLQWVLQHDNYKNWFHLEDENNLGLLWISGNPGCGKTVLARFLLESIESTLKNESCNTDQRRHVLYFFFDDKYDKQKSAVSLFRTILH
jgi:Cdc6-like AAA superfamily ATPase